MKEERKICKYVIGKMKKETTKLNFYLIYSWFFVLGFYVVARHCYMNIFYTGFGCSCKSSYYFVHVSKSTLLDSG